MAGAACTRAVLAACSAAFLRVAVTTELTPRKARYWAVTTVKSNDDGIAGFVIIEAIERSAGVPAADVKIEASWLGNTVKVWWKIK